MLSKIIDFSVQQRAFVLAMVLAVVVAGGRAFNHIPIEAFPDVQDVQVQVITTSPGMATEEVERVVTMPIEREMSGVPSMTNVRSVSMAGLSVVTLTFADHTNDYFARQQVLEKLQNVSLPSNLLPGLAPLTNAVGEIVRYVIDAPPNMPITEVRSLQDWVIRPAIRRLSGVADVTSFGGAIKEYQINILPERLKKFQVTVDQVSQAVANNNANGGGGIVRRGDEALVLRTVGIFNRMDDIGSVVVTARGGEPILVRDVAQIGIGEKPRSGYVGFGDRADMVEGVVQMIKGQNAAVVADAVKRQFPEIDKLLPAGVKIKPFYSRTDLVKHTTATVGENLLVGAGLVIAILLIFLRDWRIALLVTSMIPLSLLFAFLVMDGYGVSANLISLGGVDFGIIIDSAVVLVEALIVKLAFSPDTAPARLNALRETATELSHPILFAKAIIILAFLPIFTFQRVEQKIFSPMAFTLSFALLGAVLLSLTYVPTMLSYIVEKRTIRDHHMVWMERLEAWYRRTLALTAKSPKLVLAISSLILGVTLMVLPFLGSEFLPKLDEGNIWLTITLPQSAAIEKTKEIEGKVRSILAAYPEVKAVVSQVGRPDDGTDPKGPNNLEILADLKPKGEWRFRDKETMIADMTAKIRVIPGLPTNFSQVIQDNVDETISGVKGEISIKIFGPDLQILEAKGSEIADILSGIQGASDVASIRIGGQTELDIIPDRAVLARYGVNVSDVINTVQTALGGNAVSTFYDGVRRYDVRVRFADHFRSSIADVGNLPIALPNPMGALAPATVPLSSLAKIESRQGAARISRELGARFVAVKTNLLGRDQGSFVSEAMSKVDATVKLPEGYRMVWGGQFENQQRAMKRLEVIVPISLFSIFVLLFWAFGSFKQGGLVLAMVPFTTIGGILGLMFAGLHLSVSAAVGAIAVAGISVQNGVIMLERMNVLFKGGMDAGEASLEGAVSRLRPILMTASMAGLGLLPAALSHGFGSETQRPFAVVIVGGIISGTVFTLLLLPLIVRVWGLQKPK